MFIHLNVLQLIWRWEPSCLSYICTTLQSSSQCFLPRLIPSRVSIVFVCYCCGSYLHISRRRHHCHHHNIIIVIIIVVTSLASYHCFFEEVAPSAMADIVRTWQWLLHDVLKMSCRCFASMLITHQFPGLVCRMGNDKWTIEAQILEYFD